LFAFSFSKIRIITRGDQMTPKVVEQALPCLVRGCEHSPPQYKP
jgi:hypothetical protein